MASIHPPVCDFGWPAPDFNLINVDGRNLSRDQLMGKKGLLVMFICNHCPYVKAILPRLVADCRELNGLGINSVAIMSNDPTVYPEDGFEHMQKIAADLHFPFAYLVDPSQQVAKAYGAVCTPDFFGFNSQGQLQYRGRFDESRKETASHSSRDLFHAMRGIAETGMGPAEHKVVGGLNDSAKKTQLGHIGRRPR
jgi:peroxiredoxin